MMTEARPGREVKPSADPQAVGSVKVPPIALEAMAARRGQLLGLTDSDHMLSELGVLSASSPVELRVALSNEGRRMSEVSGSSARLQQYLRAWVIEAFEAGLLTVRKRPRFPRPVEDSDVLAYLEREAKDAALTEWFKRALRHGMDPWAPFPDETDEREWRPPE